MKAHNQDHMLTHKRRPSGKFRTTTKDVGHQGHGAPSLVTGGNSVGKVKLHKPKITGFHASY
jgi:hypothetical protein